MKKDWHPFGITGEMTLSGIQIAFANKVSISISLFEHDADTGQILSRVTSKTKPELLNGN